MEDITFDRILGLMDLLARMERFSLDSSGREYLAICKDIDSIYTAVHDLLDPTDWEGEGKPQEAVIQRIYGTPSYLKYHAVAKELFGRPFFDGVEHVKTMQEYDRKERQYRLDMERRYRGLCDD